MFRTLIALILLIACAPTPARADTSDVYREQEKIIETMNGYFPEVEVTVVWRPCGHMNAYYASRSRLIILCTELGRNRSVALLFAAHEMGHAITHQLTSHVDEQAADELAAMAMIMGGYTKELLDSAIYFRLKKEQGHVKGDPHPSAGYRAWFFACMGSWDSNDDCRRLAEVTTLKWINRLKTYRGDGI